MTDRLTLTIPEVAELLGVSPDSVRARIKDGTLPALRFGHRTLVTREAIDNLIRSAS